MQTLQAYQKAAVSNAEDLGYERLLLNLMIAIGHVTGGAIAAEDADTKPPTPLRARAEFQAVEAAIGAVLFNSAVLADRFGIDLGELAETQLAKVERITNSGRLRMLAGK